MSENEPGNKSYDKPVDDPAHEVRSETRPVYNSARTDQDDPWTDNPEVKAGAKNEEPAKQAAGNSDAWQADLVNRLAFASLNEQRRSRRWGIFFKSLTFVYLFSLLFMLDFGAEPEMISTKHAAVVEIRGPIADDAEANADDIVSGLRAAFKNKSAQAVILRISSPGGSPVQAGVINDEIYRLREKYPNKKIYASVGDMCASAAYYIAVAADEIYADKASIVGSIGVIMNSFGFEDTIKKLGVERRLMTAGKNKAFLDAFSPLKPEHKKHMQGLLDEVHEQFISVVRQGRGDRLKDSPDIFSGLFWSGEQSLELGLVDGLGSAGYIARELIGTEKIIDYTPKQNYLDRFAERIGVASAQALKTLISTPQIQ